MYHLPHSQAGEIPRLRREERTKAEAGADLHGLRVGKVDPFGTHGLIQELITSEQMEISGKNTFAGWWFAPL